MIPTTDSNTSDRDIVLSRTFLAPIDLVWAAWTDPAQVGRWWGPNGFTTTTHQMDVRPGGMWIYDMHGPDGTMYPNWIRYLEINRPHRLVYDHGGSGDYAHILFKATVDFSEARGRTTVTMRSVFPTPEARDAVVLRHGAIEGGNQHLANLEAHVAAIAAAAGSTFSTNREIPATAEQIFAAISDPERLARWWGPAGFINTFNAFEFTKNGRWSLVMHGPDGGHYPNENEFSEIIAPRLVVIQHLGSHHRFSLKISLTPTASGTLVSWTQTFENPVEAKRIEHIVVPANEENLDRLAKEVVGTIGNR